MALFNPNQRRPAAPPAARPPGRQFATADPERQREVDAASPQDPGTHDRTRSHATSGWASTRGRRGGEESTSAAEDEAAPVARCRR